MDASLRRAAEQVQAIGMPICDIPPALACTCKFSDWCFAMLRLAAAVKAVHASRIWEGRAMQAVALAGDEAPCSGRASQQEAAH